MSPPGSPAETQKRLRFELAVVLAGPLLLLCCLSFTIAGDGRCRYEALGERIEGRDWQVLGRRIADLPDGEKQRMRRYSLVGPAFSIPLLYLGRTCRSPAYWVARYNLVLFVVALIALYRLMKDVADGRALWRLALLLVAGSMFPYHLRGYCGETFTAVCAAVGIAAIWTERGAVGWPLLILAVANQPACSVGLLGVVAVRILERRRWRYGFALLAAVGIVLLESWLRRGSAFASGYENNFGFRTVMPYSGRPGFSYPFFFGLLSILLSFGKGLVFFAPGLLLLWSARNLADNDVLRRIIRAWLVFLGGMILVYAKWWAWYGGFYWGPRFLLFASVPASLALALHLWRPPASLIGKVLVLLVLTLSVWVGCNGATIGNANLDLCRQDKHQLEHLCCYTPEFSVLWRPFTAAPDARWRPLLSRHGRPHPKALLLLAYFALAYVALAGPLARSILRDLAQHARRLRDEYGHRESWRF